MFVASCPSLKVHGWGEGTRVLVVCLSYRELKGCVLGIAKGWTKAGEMESGKNIRTVAMFKTWQSCDECLQSTVRVTGLEVCSVPPRAGESA